MRNCQTLLTIIDIRTPQLTLSRPVPGTHNRLDLDGTLYVGGLGADYDRIPMPAQVWSGTRRIGYVGCMRDLVINGSVIGLATYARRQDSSEYTAARTAVRAHSRGDIAEMLCT